MTASHHLGCPECGAELPASGPEAGLCGRCLARSALEGPTARPPFAGPEPRAGTGSQDPPAELVADENRHVAGESVAVGPAALPAASGPTRLEIAAIAVILLVYLGLLGFRHLQVPAGLNNDAVEEVLAGYTLLEQGRLQVMVFEPVRKRRGVETLYVGLVALGIRLLGNTALPILLGSWISTLGILALLAWVAHRHRGLLDPLHALLAGTALLWLFHYARSGLRAICAPLVLLLLCVTLEPLTRSRKEWRPAILAGAVLGLGPYCYTSCRILILVFVAWSVLQSLSNARGSPREAGLWLLHFQKVHLSLLLVSIPNLIFAWRSPELFFGHGYYALRGGLRDWLLHVAHSLVLPVYHPPGLTDIGGQAYVFDGVAVSLSRAGLLPIHPLLGLAFFVGMLLVVTRRARPLCLFLAVAYVGFNVLIGFAGPSLTRLLILVPVYALTIAVATTALEARYRSLRPVILLVLVLFSGWGVYRYFDRLPGSPGETHYSPAATPIGMRAAELAREGDHVLCLLFKDRNVVRYFTLDHAENVFIHEYIGRRFTPETIPETEWNESETLLVEASPLFAPLIEAATRYQPEGLSAGAPFAEFDMRDLRQDLALPRRGR